MSARDREVLFRQWGVRRKTKKRKLQVALKLWTNPKDLIQVDSSARLVALLMNVKVTRKEMFALTFAPTTKENYLAYG